MSPFMLIERTLSAPAIILDFSTLITPIPLDGCSFQLSDIQ